MLRSERLAREGKIEVNVGSFEIAKLTTISEVRQMKLRYICTDFECRYNGSDANANIYEDEEGNLYATVND